MIRVEHRDGIERRYDSLAAALAAVREELGRPTLRGLRVRDWGAPWVRYYRARGERRPEKFVAVCLR